LAFSAIGHIGFIIIGLATYSINGLISTLIYFIIYIIMSLLTFSTVLIIAPNSANPITLLIGLARNQPLLAASLSLTLLSIAGVPPLAGFLSKFLVLNSAIQNGL